MKFTRFLCAALAAGSILSQPAGAQAPTTLVRTFVPIPGLQVGGGLGESVAISGTNVVVGAPNDNEQFQNSGVVKVFHATTGALLQVLPNPNPTNDRFGDEVAISGTRIVVGVPQRGSTTGIAYVFDLASGTPTVPVYTLNNPTPAAGDFFGMDVAISGDRVAIGSLDDTPSNQSGAVYVYDLGGATPTVPKHTILNPTPASSDFFGSDLALEGARLVVGAETDGLTTGGSGAAYVYDLAGATPLVPVRSLFSPASGSGHKFGVSVDVSGDRVVVGSELEDVGAMNAGAAYVFDLTSGTPTVPVATFLNPAITPGTNDNFGKFTAISGTRVLVSTGSGPVYAYDLAGPNSTVPFATIDEAGTGPNLFTPVALAGARAVIGVPRDDTGAPNAGSAFVYDLGGATPADPVLSLNDPGQMTIDNFGISTAKSGKWLVVGDQFRDTTVDDAGVVYVYDLLGATPTVPVYTLANPNPGSGDRFGTAVAMSGDRLVVGCLFSGGFFGGKAFVFDLGSGTPTVPLVLVNPSAQNVNDQFGVSVAISGTRVAVGANGEDTGGAEAGCAYVYDLTSGTPATPVLTIPNPSPTPNDQFGFSLALSGDRLVVGCYLDDTGASNAGCAYVFNLAGPNAATPVSTIPNPSPAIDDQFGYAMAMSGSRVAISVFDDTGAANAGGAYVFDLDGGSPTTPVATLVHPTPAASDFLGFSMGMSGTRVVISAAFSNIGATDSGTVYVYDLASPTPSAPIATLANPTPGNNEQFGYAVAIDGSAVAVGAPADSTAGPFMGIAYLFDVGPTPGGTGRLFAQTVLAVAGGKDKGSQVNGEATGTRFAVVGSPAVEAGGEGAAFQASLRGADNKVVKAIFAGNPGAVIARFKQTAPGASPATFKTFGDPMVSEDGIAFSAKLSDGRAGIWTTAFGNGLELAAITGAEAPGIASSKITAITSFSLRGGEIVALLKLKAGPGGVTAAKDTVLVRYGATTKGLLVSEGQDLTVDGVVSPIKKLSVFTPAKLSPGQGRSHVEGAIALNVTLGDGRIAALQVNAAGTPAVVAANRRANGTKLYRTLGLPCIGAPGVVALKGFVQGAPAATDERTLVEQSGQETPSEPAGQAEGAAAPSGGGALFGVMSDPIVNDDGLHAFVAKLTGPRSLGLTGKNNSGLYWGRQGSIAKAARLDDIAPDRDGMPTTAKFASIKSFGLPDGTDAGPVFVAKLVGPRGSGVTGKNNQGLYGVDSVGQLRELLRTDQPLSTALGSKKVKSFTALTGGLPVGGRRAFTTAGVFSVRVIFSDNTSGIVRLVVP